MLYYISMSDVQTSQLYARRWGILASVLAVLLMTPLDSSALNIAITPIQRAFHVPLEQVAWVPLVYLLVIASMILPIGRLGDLLGFRRLYLSGVAVFTISSALCGFSPNLAWLIVSRVLQGIGACMMMSISSGIATSIFPPQERGRALGLVGMAVAVGLVLGPTLAGLLIGWQGWRWIFFINVPIGLFGGLWCAHMLPPLPPAAHHRIDWLGALLAILMLGSFFLVITHGDVWGWFALQTVACFGIFLASSTLFFRHEHRHPTPMLDLYLFKNRVFAGGNLASMMNYLGQYCVIFLTPLLLQQALQFNARVAGLMMGVLPLVLLVVAPVSGALSDRFGTRALATIGETLVALGLLAMAYVAPHGHVMELIPVLAFIGVGTGLFQAPNNSAVMGCVPRTHLGIGGSMLATMRNLGMAFGIATSSAVATIGAHHYLIAHPGALQQAFIHGISLGYVVGACFAFLGAITSAVRQDQLRVG